MQVWQLQEPFCNERDIYISFQPEPIHWAPISMRTVYAIQWNGVFPFEFDEKLMETETKTWSEYPNEAKAIVEQILESEES